MKSVCLLVGITCLCCRDTGVVSKHQKTKGSDRVENQSWSKDGVTPSSNTVLVDAGDIRAVSTPVLADANLDRLKNCDRRIIHSGSEEDLSGKTLEEIAKPLDKWEFIPLQSSVLPAVSEEDRSIVAKVYFNKTTVNRHFDELFIRQGTVESTVRSSRKATLLRLKAGVGVQSWMLGTRRFLIDLPATHAITLLYDRRQGVAPQSTQYPCSSGGGGFISGCPVDGSKLLPSIQFKGPIREGLLSVDVRTESDWGFSELPLSLDAGEMSRSFTLVPTTHSDYPVLRVGSCEYHVVQRKDTKWIVSLQDDGTPLIEVTPQKNAGGR